MKKWALVFFLISISPAFGAACNEGCLSETDCDSGSHACRICIGTCVSCGALGDSTTCGDSSTGAATRCFWSTVTLTCRNLPGIPEYPEGVKFIYLLIFPMLVFGFYLFKNKNHLKLHL